MLISAAHGEVRLELPFPLGTFCCCKFAKYSTLSYYVTSHYHILYCKGHKYEETQFNLILETDLPYIILYKDAIKCDLSTA